MSDINLKPGRLSITERYGVPPPQAALEAALWQHCPDKAAIVLAEYRTAARRYSRAVKVDNARRRVQDHERTGWDPPPGSPAHRARARAVELLARAREFIDTDG